MVSYGIAFCQNLIFSKHIVNIEELLLFFRKGDFLIDGAAETLAMLRQKGKRLFFVTNNSTKSRKGYMKKFQSLGLEVSPEGTSFHTFCNSFIHLFILISFFNYSEIFSSSFAAAAYFEKNPLPPGKKVYVVGQEGIGEELDLIGVPHIGGPTDAGKSIKIAPGVKIDHDPDVGAVVVGFDGAINYYKIQYAQLCISENPGCRFVATNLDAVAHLTEAQEWAGNGSMVGAIKGCTGREPIVVGKPSALMIDYIVDKFKVDRSRICMVGDRLDTDILFGHNNGLETMLTLSGVTKESTLWSEKNHIYPDYVVNSIADLLDC